MIIFYKHLVQILIKPQLIFNSKFIKYKICIGKAWKFSTRSFIQVAYTFTKNLMIILQKMVLCEYNVLKKMNLFW